MVRHEAVAGWSRPGEADRTNIECEVSHTRRNPEGDARAIRVRYVGNGEICHDPMVVDEAISRDDLLMELIVVLETGAVIQGGDAIMAALQDKGGGRRFKRGEEEEEREREEEKEGEREEGKRSA